MFDFIGVAFKSLQQALGSVLAFFYEILVPPLNAGLGQGLAIILLTIFISLVIFPLTLKQTRATRAFSAIQPEIKRIQKEYKDDPPEMQKRLMATQKSAGATPGGCLLPLVVQMPIWFALFRLLQTPFVVDESGDLVEGAAHAMDPTSSLGMFILSDETATFLGMNLGTTPSEAMAVGIVFAIPYLLMMALMGTTQYVQTWHSTYGQDKPTGQGAGAQQMITKIMPLFIVVISYNFPAGLVLYWTTSNLFRFGQQVLIFRIDGRPPPPGAAAAQLESPEPDDSGNGNGEVKGPQEGAANKRRRRRRK